MNGKVGRKKKWKAEKGDRGRGEGSGRVHGKGRGGREMK
jgi:hypothetical protein